MTGLKVIRALVRHIQPVLTLVPLERSRCVLTTAVGIDVLRHFDIKARPLSVRVELVNGAFRQWADEGYPGGEAAGLARGAWSLMAGDPGQRATDGGGAAPLVEPPSHAWDGHLVVDVPFFGLFLDLDLQQMNRPTKNIRVPPAMAFRWNMGRDVGYVLEDCAIRYTARPDDRTWSDAKDWTDPGRRIGIVATLIELIERRKG